MPSLNKSFLSNGKVFLVVCNKCKHENYAMAVCDGICVWCGYNGNEDEEYKKTLEEHKDAK